MLRISRRKEPLKRSQRKKESHLRSIQTITAVGPRNRKLLRCAPCAPTGAGKLREVGAGLFSFIQDKKSIIAAERTLASSHPLNSMDCSPGKRSPVVLPGTAAATATLETDWRADTKRTGGQTTRRGRCWRRWCFRFEGNRHFLLLRRSPARMQSRTSVSAPAHERNSRPVDRAPFLGRLAFQNATNKNDVPAF